MKAFQGLGSALASKPDDAPTLELLLSLFRQQLEARDYAPIVQGVQALEDVPAIGVKPRLRNVRGMAFLMAACDDDPERGQLFTKPLEFALKDFRKAAELDPQLVEAQVHLGIALFLHAAADPKTAAADRDEARAVLLAARDKIRAPESPDGHGLPFEAEAILDWLSGKPELAGARLDRGPRTPWGSRIRAAMASRS